jgi:putative transposase
VLEARRRIAARLLAQGTTVTEVAAAVGASPSSVLRWQQAIAADGEAALAAKWPVGRPPKLDAGQTRQLLKALHRGGKSWGFSTDEWNCPRVRQLIRRLFDVEYHVDYVGTILHRLGWSVHQVEFRARERDEAAIARWRREEWPRLKKETRTSS